MAAAGCAAGPLHARRRRLRARRRRPRVVAGHAVPRGLQPDAGSRHRQHRAIHADCHSTTWCRWRRRFRRAYLGMTTAGTVTADWDAAACALRFPRASQPMTIARCSTGPSSSRYLVVITAIGLIVGYRVRHSREYFLGGRRFGPWVMIGQSFSVGTHAEMPVALAGAVYGTRRVGHLVPVEEPLHHAALLDHGAGLPAHPPDDDGGVHRGSVRPVDGRHLHRLRGLLLHHRNRRPAQGRRQSDQPGDRRHRRRERNRRRHDGDVHPLQLRRRAGGVGVDRSLPGVSDHRPVVHADSARLARGRRARRDEGVAARRSASRCRRHPASDRGSSRC